MFGRKREDPPPPPKSEPTPKITETRIEATITGAVHLNDDRSFRISGEAPGDLTCEAVEIVESGSMTGNLEANWVTIAGKFEGRIKTNLLTVATTAVARGDFFVRDSIVIEPNADFRGQLTRPGDDDEPAAVEAAPSTVAGEDTSAPPAASNGDGHADAPEVTAPTPLFASSTGTSRHEDDTPTAAPARAILGGQRHHIESSNRKHRAFQTATQATGFTVRAIRPDRLARRPPGWGSAGLGSEIPSKESASP